jgi:hypothetical protein
MCYQSFKKILSKNKRFFTTISLEIFFGLLILLYFPSFLNSLGPEATVASTWIVIISEILIIFLFITFLIIKFIEKIKHKRIDNWIKATLLLMIIFLIIGWGLIAFNYGETEINLVLRNSENIGQVIGNITCSDNAKKVIVDHEIKCIIYPNISIISANVTFTLYNDSKISKDFINLNFTAPRDCKYVYFKISGINQNIKTVKLEVGYPMTFYTEQENQSRNEKYIGFVILLFGAVLFSVPSMMNNFKDLNECNKEQKTKIKRSAKKNFRSKYE